MPLTIRGRTPKGSHRQTSSFVRPRPSQPAVLVWRWLVRPLAQDSVLSKRSATFVFRSANLNGMLSIIIAAIMSGEIDGKPSLLTAILSSPDARDRKSVGYGKSVSVRVYLDGRSHLQK